MNRETKAPRAKQYNDPRVDQRADAESRAEDISVHVSDRDAYRREGTGRGSGPPTCLWRWREVTARTGLPRASIYALMARNEFPQSVPLSPRTVAWVSGEVQTWINQRVALARSDIPPLREIRGDHGRLVKQPRKSKQPSTPKRPRGRPRKVQAELSEA